MFAHASHFGIEASTFINVGRDYVVNIGGAQTPVRPELGIDDVLCCPPPSKDFVGRESILQKLSKFFAAPVVSITCAKPEMMEDIVTRVKGWSGFSFVKWDASSEDGLENGLDEWNSVVGRTPKNTLLMLESADPSLDLDSYIPYSLQTPVLILSMSSRISAFASNPGCIFMPPASMNKPAYRKFLDNVRKAFVCGQRIVPLVARGGTGKTQVARKFVQEYGWRFSHHWVVDASSESTLVANFKILGNAANIGNEVQDICQFLKNQKEEWLLIFDNADHGVNLVKYIPQCNHGNIIITSRDKDVHQLSSDRSFGDIADLSEDEAIKLLLKSASQEDTKDTHLAIVHALGCQALAIATAGTYVSQHPTCQLKDYLKVFNQKHDALLKYPLRTVDRYERTILAAFYLSFDFLSPPTQAFMQMCSFFHHFSIPVDIFYRGISFTKDKDEILPGEEESVNLIAEKLISFVGKFSTNLEVDASINELAKLSLTAYNPANQSLSFHPVVHHCAQQTIGKDNPAHTATLLLAHATPGYGVSGDDYNFQRQLFPHAHHLFQDRTSFPGVFISLKLSYIFKQEGHWSIVERLERQVLQSQKTALGEQHPATLTSMSNLALTYRCLGRYNEAEILGKEVVQVRKAVHGDQHPHTLTSMSNLASTYSSLGRYNEAEALGKEVIQVCRTVHGDQHLHTLTSMSNLALTYSSLGRYSEAERLGKEVVQVCKTVLGDQHPGTLTSMSNLALTYSSLGRYNEAEVLGKEVVEVCRTVFGGQHPDTLTSMSNLALTYSSLGRYNEAEALGKEVVQACKTILGDQHPDTLTSMSNLSLTYSNLGRYNKAEVLGKEVLQIRKTVLGDQHPDTLASMSNLVLTFYHLRRYNEAEVMGKEVLQIRKTVLGPQHPHTLTSMSILASNYSQLGKYNEAELLEKEVMQTRKTVLGDQHPDTLTSMSNLALTYHHLRRYSEAEVLGKEVVQIRKTVLGAQHPDTLTSMSNLASIYSSFERHDEAEILGKEVVQVRKTVLGAQHPQTLTSMSILASSYSLRGKYNEAEVLEKELVQISKTVLGDQHPGTLAFMSKLALNYIKMGRFKEAEALQHEIAQIKSLNPTV